MTNWIEFNELLKLRGKVLTYLIGEKKTGHKINRVKLLVGGNFSHFSPTKFSVLGK